MTHENQVTLSSVSFIGIGGMARAMASAIAALAMPYLLNWQGE